MPGVSGGTARLTATGPTNATSYKKTQPALSVVAASGTVTAGAILRSPPSTVAVVSAGQRASGQNQQRGVPNISNRQHTPSTTVTSIVMAVEPAVAAKVRPSYTVPAAASKVTLTTPVPRPIKHASQAGLSKEILAV